MEHPSIAFGVKEYLRRFRFESVSTKKTYGAALRIFLEWQVSEGHPIQEALLEDLPSDIVNDFFTWIENQGKSKATAYLYRQALLRALEYWRYRGWISFTSDEERSARRATGCTGYFTHPPGKLACKGLETLE